MESKEAANIIRFNLIDRGGCDSFSSKEIETLNMAAAALEAQPFINKPCISEGVCHEDKLQVLDKIRAEIEQIADEEQKYDEKWAIGLRYAVKIIDKYKAESEDAE